MKSGRWEVLDGARRPDRALILAGSGFVTLELLGVLLGALLGAVAWLFARRDRVEVDVAAERVRMGRRTASFADITQARLDAGALEPVDLSLRLTGGGLTFVVPLRDGDRLLLTPRATALLEAIVAGSGIAMPTDRYDPTGRFARYNFPSHLTRDQTLDLVRDPPRKGEALPIPS